MHSRLTVFTSGGIGNQLFQFTFAHYLQRFSSDVNVEIEHIPSKLSYGHSKVSLFEKLESCSHCAIGSRWKGAEVGRARDPWQRLSLPYMWRRVDYKDWPCSVIDQAKIMEILKSKYVVGYFQNRKYLENVIEDLDCDLQNLLNRIIMPADLLNTDFEVIHVRRGDTLVGWNKMNIGVLDKRYYHRSLSRRKEFARIVVTNDKPGAMKIASELYVDEIYGEEDLDVFQTLRLMSSARNLICANSTLSWWGGLMAQRSGAAVQIPEPFYRNPNLGSKEAFNLSGFKQEPATFEF
jgi:hypothetical protein